MLIKIISWYFLQFFFLCTLCILLVISSNSLGSWFFFPTEHFLMLLTLRKPFFNITDHFLDVKLNYFPLARHPDNVHNIIKNNVINVSQHSVFSCYWVSSAKLLSGRTAAAVFCNQQRGKCLGHSTGSRKFCYMEGFTFAFPTVGLSNFSTLKTKDFQGWESVKRWGIMVCAFQGLPC